MALFPSMKLEYAVAALLILIFVASVFSLIIFDHVEPEVALYWTSVSVLNASGIVQEAGFYSLRSVEVFTVIDSIAHLILLTFVISNFVVMLGRVDIKKRDIMRRIANTEDHVIVCGYGKVGEKVCEVLDDHTLEYVVVENEPAAIAVLKERDILVVEGDATDSKVLRLAGVERAGALVATLGSDTDNIYTVLTAKELNPNLIIATRAVSEEVVSKMHRAGAEIVVMPDVVAGLELGKEVIGEM